MEKQNIMIVGTFTIMLLLVGLVGGLYFINKDRDTNLYSYKLEFITPEIIKEYKGSEVIQYESELDPTFKIGVFGTIYEKRDNMTIYGWCVEYNNSPVIATASVTVYSRDNTTWLNSTPMIELVEPGKFYYNDYAPNTTGNYLIEFNCTRISDGAWGIAYSEIEVPQVLQTIQDQINNISFEYNETNLTEILSKLDILINYSTQINATTTIIENLTSETYDLVTDLLNLVEGDILDWSTTILGDRNYGNNIYFYTEVINYDDLDAVSCNLTTSFWGNNPMTFNDISENFIYEEILNSTGLFNWSVECDEN